MSTGTELLRIAFDVADLLGRWLRLMAPIAATWIYLFCPSWHSINPLVSHSMAVGLFAAFRTMAGLAFTAFGIIASASGDSKFGQKLSTPAGAAVIRHLLGSAAAWLIVSLFTLVAGALRPNSYITAAVVALTVLACVQSLLMIVGVAAIWADEMRG